MSYAKYLETEVLGADPLKLICMLYRGAIDATAAARRHLKAGQIRERSRQVMRAVEILHELSRSLDPQYEISVQLGELYAYMQQRLLEANSKQIDEPLSEVEQLLTTLHDGWKSASIPPPSAMATEAYQPVCCTY